MDNEYYKFIKFNKKRHQLLESLKLAIAYRKAFDQTDEEKYRIVKQEKPS